MSTTLFSEQPTAVQVAIPTSESATLSVTDGAPSAAPAVTPIAGYEMLDELGGGSTASCTS
jgi:hypothetical protein